MDTTSTLPTAPRPHGRKMKAFKGNPEMETSAAERGDLAILLRADGLGWRQIAERLGYTSAAGAYNCAMRRALQIAPATKAERDAARPRALAMIDQSWTLVEMALASADADERAKAMDHALQLIRLYALWLGCPLSQTPLAARLPRFGLALKEVQP